jgi:chromosome segregation ATPase
MTERLVLLPATPADDDARSGAVVSNRERLTLTVHELAADLARARRDCRDKQQQIDSLKGELARLLPAASPVTGRDDLGKEVPGDRSDVRKLGTRRNQHEHALERMSSAVLILRRGNLALKEENASLRLELARQRASNSGSG